MTDSAWSRKKERGSDLLIRFMIWLTLKFGWHVGFVLLLPISAYFFCFSGGARAASRHFLGRALGRPASSADVFRHIFTFACVLLDRLFLLSGRLGGFRIDVVGLDHLTSVAESGRGCVLFGAHFGSFEVLRAFGRSSPVPVRALMYRANAGAYSRLMDRLDPRLREEIIEIGAPEAMLQVRDSLRRGEIVGILSDRTTCPRKAMAVSFLGEPALFPTGPVSVAAALEVPVVLFFGIRKGNRHYEVRFEPFAEHLTLSAEGRAAELRDWVGRYAGRLEAQCRVHPYNWFNFYDFWSPRLFPAARADAADAPVRGGHGAGGLGGVARSGARTSLAP
jgi:predicted LPLAT superfamily acyltransferase